MYFDREAISTYYNRTEWIYKNYWNLNESFGLHFGFWNSSTKKLADAIVYQNEWMANKVGISAAFHVLDAGCGIGGSSIYLAKHYNCQVTGITITGKQVHTASKNAELAQVGHKVIFLEQDFVATTFKSETFDVVWAIESVCHANNKSDFLKEAFRILKKGGKLIIADYFLIKEDLNKKEIRQLYTKGINGWAVGSLCTYHEFETCCKHLGFEQWEWNNVNSYTRPSVNKLIQKTSRWLLPGYLYFKFGGITPTEYYNALGSYNFCKQFEKLWNYEVFVATK